MQVHLAGLEVRVRPRVGAGADRDEEHLLLAGRPAEVVRLESRHQEELEGRVVEHRDAAVDEDERLAAADVDHLGREERRRRGARAHELPERDVEVPELALGPVVERPRIVGERPRRVRRRVAHHDQQQRPQPVAPERRLLAELPPQPRGEPIVLVLEAEAVEQAGLVEHVRRRSRRRTRGSGRRTSRPRGTSR